VSTKLKDKETKIQQIIAKLAEESSKGKPIVVEGKKDTQALWELGINGRILTVKSGGKSFLESTIELEKLGTSEVILLLDLDRRGKEGTFRLKRNLEGVRIKANTKFWTDLQGLVGRDIKCIEGLTTYLNTLHQKAMRPSS